MTAVAGAHAASDPGPELESRLLAEAFEGMGPGPWSVLDLGPARPTTLAFFRQFRCRLGFADAQPALAAIGRQWPMDPTLVWYELREAVPVDPARPWRLVLLWDLLDYLPPGALEAVMQRLAEGMAPGSRLHGFVTSTAASVPAAPADYEILTRERLRRHPPVSTATVNPARHTPWHLERHMPGVTLDRSRQRQDGRQEHLLRYDGSDAVRHEPTADRARPSSPSGSA